MSKIIKFDDLKVVEFGTTRGLHTIFQSRIYKMIQRSKTNSISLKNFIDAYIRLYGNEYEPRIREVYSKDSVILGNPNTISYHYKYKTAEWKLYLRPYFRQRFIKVIGQLVANGCLGVLPILKDK
jgi:hypothetical protein